jgi:hypothetical protein
MNTKVNALIKKIEEAQEKTITILGDLKNWKSYPNEDASSDRLIERVFKEVEDFFNTANCLQKMSEEASQLHTQQLDGIVDDIMHKRGIYK